MLLNRTFQAGIILFWIASMTWLGVTKVWPLYYGGDQPEYLPVSSTDSDQPTIESWTLLWNDRPAGFSSTEKIFRDDGSTEVRSVLRIDALPVDELLHELLGAAARFVAPALGDGPHEYPITVATTLHFGPFDELQSIESRIDVAEMDDFIRVDGRVRENELTIDIRVGTGDVVRPITRTIHLPDDAIVVDSFSPSSRLRRLRVGQRWTFQVYRPLSPRSPLRMVEATVERKEEIEHHGDAVETFVVVYRDDAGAGVTVTQRPLGQMWVAADGTVLKQRVWISSITIDFLRQDDTSRLDSLAPYFDD